ncbi:MAG: amidohydrolase family protein [Microvirga sp.]|nr:amidohydrolase family protein [Microvirga sp.]
MERTLIIGGVLVEEGETRGARADLLMEGGLIAAIFRGGAPAGIDADRFDAGECAILPGLVNGHLHAHSNMAKGMGDRWTLEMSLTNAPWISGVRSLDEIYASAAIGAAEMLLKGCTAAYDMCLEFPLPTADGIDAVARAYDDVGMRATIAPMASDQPFLGAVPGLRDHLVGAGVEGLPQMSSEGPDGLLSRFRALAQGWRWPSDRIRFGLGPAIPFLCSDAFLTGVRDLSAEFGIGIHTHVSESKVQTVVSGETFGETITAKLHRLGLLGPRFTAAHGVWLDGDDMRRMADTGANVIHNPASNFRLGSGVANVRAFLDAGVHVGLGTDGASCADGLNMFEAMRLATHASRVFGAPVDEWIGAREALHAATAGSARALGFGDSIGALREGAAADVVILDLRQPHYTPMNDLSAQIVYAEDSSGVRDVFVGGRCVVRERRLTRIDYDQLRRRTQAAADRLHGANAETRARLQHAARLAEAYCRCFIGRETPASRYICE